MLINCNYMAAEAAPIKANSEFCASGLLNFNEFLWPGDVKVSIFLTSKQRDKSTLGYRLRCPLSFVQTQTLRTTSEALQQIPTLPTSSLSKLNIFKKH